MIENEAASSVTPENVLVLFGNEEGGGLITDAIRVSASSGFEIIGNETNRTKSEWLIIPCTSRRNPPTRAATSSGDSVSPRDKRPRSKS